ncbi:disulfide bond formation protein B [Pseudorhodobacter ferrugineus]|uniref:disulfide bond formation protein B n=1 Tax=Pseudorhodobacter ferrugineus TaxID=77008 RepID=UPI0003B563E3|nr:disulfide bond formation protein B [Pseudorhodobacter ferrugineus]
MTRPPLTLLAAGGSAALLLGAFAFQYIGGMSPCTLCIWQRWPHAAAVLIGVLALTIGGRYWGYLGALSAATTAGIGMFHTGVERGWWEGLASCSAGSIKGLSVAELLDPTANVAAPVRCDAVPWEMFTLSMASWNMILSLVLVALWLSSVRRA